MLLKRKVYSEIIHLKPKYTDHLYDITSLVEFFIESSKLKNGLVNIYVKSCTASIMILENGDNSAKKDIIKFLQQLVPPGNWEIDKTNLNGNAYLKAALIGSSKMVPFLNRRLVISGNQRIFLCEFDNPNMDREIIITPIRNL